MKIFFIEFSHVNDIYFANETPVPFVPLSDSEHKEEKSTNCIIKVKKSFITVKEQNKKILNTELLTYVKPVV